ncbi:hypothetical protein [Pseudoxanthomonas sp. JBR18]|uniref:hypothetical protein n=1 Tax=Pseudoxanthomonas sp. JBR18 TaxID=2969308 RepID=UPI002306742F|nr:hypothetical protein [Pseudoxanthomonas sp. JBR18]WCE04466.1 hypothetical protein PJ250_00185 [Pseudoxanthomonas sp. JBR18]
MATAYDNWLEGACGVDDDAEAIGDLIANFAADPEKVAEADELADGEQSGEHYSELERAMADLDGVEPADLLGSEVLTRLYRLAKVHGAARREKLQELAEAAFETHREESAEMRAEMRRDSRQEWAA